MNEQIFWSLVDQSNPSADGLQAKPQAKIFAQTVSAQLPNHLQPAYQVILAKVMERCNTLEMKMVAYVLLQGSCNAKDFLTFQCWLILRGQKIYRAAINDPEVLLLFAPAFRFQKIQLSKLHPIQTHLHVRAIGLIKKNLLENFAFTQTVLTHQLPQLCHAMGWGNTVYEGNWQTDHETA